MLLENTFYFRLSARLILISKRQKTMSAKFKSYGSIRELLDDLHVTSVTTYS